jgi:DNA-directed RNA polymerase specialized sigma24 family protein
VNDHVDMKRSEKTINSLSFKFHRRIQAMGGRSHVLDDVRQEMWIAFCKARDTFDPDMGASFNTYLTKGIMLHMNRHIEKSFERFHGQTVALSLDAESFGAEGKSLSEVVPDDNAIDAEQAAFRSFAFKRSQVALSPKAAEFVRLLDGASETLAKDFLAFDAKAEHAKTMGLVFARPSRVTSSMIFDLMGVGRWHRAKISQELTEYAESASK